MKIFISNFLKDRIVSPWVILAIDIGLVVNAFVLVYAVRFNASLNYYVVSDLLIKITWVSILYLIAFIVSGSYKGVIRQSNYTEFKLVLFTNTVVFIFLLLLNGLVKYLGFEKIFISRFILVFHFVMTVVLMVAFRIFVKEVYALLTRKRASVNVFIYGAGNMGQITLEAIKNDKDSQYNVVGFVDDNASRWGVKISSLPVISWDKALNVGAFKGVKAIVLSNHNITIIRKQEIINSCIEKGWKLKVMPTVNNWVNGISNDKQIRDIQIEDILGRDEIKLNVGRIMDGLNGKTILVTGAAGSIGSEIVRQLLRYSIRRIIMMDIAESALYDLQQELSRTHSDAPFEVVLGDVTNKKRLREVFRQYTPEVVFNAAAYKHVPLMEAFPYEAIRVNIGGAKNLADLAVEFDVEKFVMVSTDKAVNPTNVMGASKRICEIYIQALAQRTDVKTAFITTRFGNVLGSNGSVVPLFKRQIARGGPVTVTHKDITRYFMTIPEACQLVLEAGFMGVGGEIFLFDMGEPVKISELAKEMIRLSGLKEDEDIKIVYTGLRPGEKLYEELLATKENTLPTHHEKIMIGRTRKVDFEDTNIKIRALINAIEKEDELLFVARMKELVPEYKSMNSRFCQLDEPIDKVLLDGEGFSSYVDVASIKR